LRSKRLRIREYFPERTLPYSPIGGSLSDHDANAAGKLESFSMVASLLAETLCNTPSSPTPASYQSPIHDVRLLSAHSD
ncbi:unnamed protein product, partial [marine sediment metagenome]